MRKYNHSNENLVALIEQLKELSKQEKSAIWGRLADDLAKPSRIRRVVNLSRINYNTANDETIVVPGKVLASGDLSHKVTVAAFKFSKSALEKISKAQGKALSLQDLMKEKKLNKVRIIG